jgi:hypothetical protein
MEEPITSSPASSAADDQNIADTSGPLALNPHQLRPEVEDQIVTLAVGQGLEHAHSELRRRMSDGELGSPAFLVCRKHSFKVVGG